MNLSNITLTDTHKTLLNLGMSFIPTVNAIDKTTIYTALHKLTRYIKLKDYFGEDEDYDPNDFIYQFREKSKWTPKDELISEETNQLIGKLVTSTARILGRYPTQENKILINDQKQNLPLPLKKALYELKNNKNIIIKAADKGAMTCIMNRNDYIREAYRQLNNTKYYRRITDPCKPTLVNTINHTLTKLHEKNIISDEQYSFLQANPRDRDRKFYLLPKIHKAREKWPFPNMPEGRPIVSDCGSESKHTSDLIDYYIKPLANRHSSYLKDTYDFIQKVSNKVIDKDHLIVSGDITALYTNMDIPRTLETLKREFETNPQPGRPDDEILSLLTVIMTHNDFIFNEERFLQIFGTAMGKTFAPNLANIYLLDLDRQAMEGFRIKPTMFFRYLDDIFFIWPGTREELTEFENYLNSLIPSIKITLNVSDTHIDFLDTTIFKQTINKKSSLRSKVFFKATDTHQLLHQTSFHPPHTTAGIVKSQIIRFKRICSYKEDFDEACSILFNALYARGYNRRLLRKTKHHIWHNYNTKQSIKDNKPIIPIVIPFSPLSTQLVREWKRIISKSPTLNGYRTLGAYTKHKNLQEILTRATLPTLRNQKTNGMKQHNT